MRNYALDTKMLPQVWVTWASTKSKDFHQRYWLNCQTGKKKTTPEKWMLYDSEGDMNRRWGSNDTRVCVGNYWKTNQIWAKNGATVRFTYAKYHQDIDRLEVAVVEMPTTRAEEPHAWKFVGNRFYIARDKTILLQDGKHT